MNFWKKLVSFGGVLILCAAGGWAAAPEWLGEHEYIHEEFLPNGLSLLVKEDHSAPVVHVAVYVKTGSIHEAEYIGHGICHHIEHIVSGGSTQKRTEAEYEKLSAQLGGAGNAYTTRDHTCYHLTSSSGNLELMLEILSEWAFECAFDEGEFEREHGVIQREIEMGMEEPTRRLWQLTTETMFRVHPVRYPTIGYKDNFLRLTRDDLVTYYNRWYTPENAVVVVVGDVRTEDVVQYTEATFGQHARRSSPTIDLPEEPPQVSMRVGEEGMDTEIAYVRLAWRTITVAHPDLYPLDLLSYILTRGESSLLVKEIRDEKRLVTDISSYSYTPGYEGGMFAITVQLEPEKMNDAESAILQAIGNLKTSKFDSRLVEKAKKQKITEYIFANQSVEEQAQNIARWAYLSTYDKHFYSKYVDRIQNVTAEELHRVLNEYFSEENLTVARVVPNEYLTSSFEAGEEGVTRAVEKTVLPNGVRLLTKIDDSSPLVTVLASFKGGTLYEEEGENGISNFAVRMLSKGTRGSSGDEIAEEMDLMGIDLTASGGSNSFYVGFNLVASDFERAMELLAEMIQHPTFPPEEVDRMREQLLAGLARRRSDWLNETADFFRQEFFGEHPYRWPVQGSEDALQEMTSADLKEFHEKFVSADNMVLAVFGDIEDLPVEKTVERLFSDLPREAAFDRTIRRESVGPTDSERKVLPTDREIAAIYMGYPGMTVDNVDDRYPMEVLDAVTSGIYYPGGWLHNELRGRELVYVVHAFNWMGLDHGYFGIYAATTPEQLEETVSTIVEQMERIKTEDIPDEEFEEAKGIAVTMEKLRYEANYDQALRAALNELYGLGYDFHTTHEERIRAVSEADVKRVAEKYLKHYLLITALPEAG